MSTLVKALKPLLAPWTTFKSGHLFSFRWDKQGREASSRGRASKLLQSVTVRQVSC